MTTVFPILLGAVLAAWSMLSLFSGEHERRTREIASAPKPKESDNPEIKSDPSSKPAKPPAASGSVR